MKILLKDEYFIYMGVPVDELLFYENVQDYSHPDFTSVEIEVPGQQMPITEERLKLNDNKQIYCVLDTPSSGNFGHFFWECLIYLKTIKRINKKYPNVIFLFKETKKFKQKILDSYSIKYSTKIENFNNYVGFFPLITALVSDKYSLQYDKLIRKFHEHLHADSLTKFEKDLEIVYFPRHVSVDNTYYEGQDRSYNASEIVNFINSRPNTLIFETEKSKSWGEEFRTIQRAKFIICHDGSSGSVISFCARGSIIIMLSHNITLPSMNRFDKVRSTEEVSRECNEKYYINAPNNIYTLDLVMPLLTRQILTH
jgi:hypothetical protein